MFYNIKIGKTVVGLVECKIFLGDVTGVIWPTFIFALSVNAWLIHVFVPFLNSVKVSSDKKMLNVLVKNAKIKNEVIFSLKQTLWTLRLQSNLSLRTLLYYGHFS